MNPGKGRGGGRGEEEGRKEREGEKEERKVGGRGRSKNLWGEGRTGSWPSRPIATIPPRRRSGRALSTQPPLRPDQSPWGINNSSGSGASVGATAAAAANSGNDGGEERVVATGRNIGSLNVLVESEVVRRRESENRNQLLDEMRVLRERVATLENYFQRLLHVQELAERNIAGLLRLQSLQQRENQQPEEGEELPEEEQS